MKLTVFSAMIIACSAIYSAGANESLLTLNEASGTFSITHAGLERTGQFFIPKNTATYGLIIVLHGMDSSADFVHTNAFDVEAGKNGFIMLYPEAYNNNWDINPGQPTGSDDLGYFKTLIAAVSRQYFIDKDRIFIIGHSLGGVMAYRAGSELKGLVKAIAPISAALAKPEIENETVSTSLFHIHAKNDTVIPLSGLPFSHPVVRGVEEWLNAAEINATGHDILGPKDSQGIAWSDPQKGVTVQYLLYPYGGHDWLPGVEKLILDFFTNLSEK